MVGMFCLHLFEILIFFTIHDAQALKGSQLIA